MRPPAMFKTLVFPVLFATQVAAEDEDEKPSGMRYIEGKQFIDADCSSQQGMTLGKDRGEAAGPAGLTRFYEGCYGNEEGSYQLEIDGKELTLKTYDAQGCDTSDKIETFKEKDGECTEKNQKWEVLELKSNDDYFKYTKYDHKEEGCEDDNLVESAIVLLDGYENKCHCKCKEKGRRLADSSEAECILWEKLIIDDNSNMIWTRYDDDSCKENDKSEKYPTLTLPGTGECKILEDFDCDKDPIKSNLKVWLTKGGKPSNGQNLRISQSVIALASLGLMATLV